MTEPMTKSLTSSSRAGVGESPVRPDAPLKVKGEFAYSSDLWIDGMLWGATLRSPHPRARITGLDIARALAMPGVYAVLTHEDVPGSRFYGIDKRDQPVLAIDEVRYQGEPVAVVAADHPETARRAVDSIEVGYEVLEPIFDAHAALFDPASEQVHPGTNLVRHQPVRVGDPDDPTVRQQCAVVVARDYEVGMQDQAFLGPESGLAIPAEDGGVELYVATQ